MSYPKDRPMSEEAKAKRRNTMLSRYGALSTSGFASHVHSEEARTRISQGHLGKPKSAEHREKIAAAHRGKPKNYPVWNKGRSMPLAERQSLSEKMRGKYCLTPEQKIRQLEGTRRVHLGIKWTEEQKRKLSFSLRNNSSNIERKRKIKAASRRNWSNSEFVRMMFRAFARKPNKVETRIDQILMEQWPNDWKYVGDGQCVIGGKLPDFINVNGKKAIIEVFGRYWHKQTDAATRTKHFNRYGFKILCVWEDITDEQFIEKVHRKFYASQQSSSIGTPEQVQAFEAKLTTGWTP